MTPGQFAFFREAHRLDPKTAAGARACKICGAPSRVFDRVDFLKFCSTANCYAFGVSGVGVTYARCGGCGFIFTDFFDDWTPADFARHVYNEDYALVDGEYASIRPAAMADEMIRVLQGRTDLRILDYGSGSGAFAERMRARGVERVESYDPFSSPSRPEGLFDLITCFEVIEHTISPHRALSDMQSFMAAGSAIVFSQALQPPDIEQVRGSWWYIAPRNGHVSIFTAESLAELAGGVGLLFHKGVGWYGFAGPEPSAQAARILGRIGPPFVRVELFAPATPAAGEAWHSIEQDGDRRYRWSGAPELVWPSVQLPSQRCRLLVKVPIVNEIQEGFAASCRIEIGGADIPVALDQGRLVAEIDVEGQGEASIRLVTPPPLSPFETRGVPDRRRLGLAIPLPAGGDSPPRA